jgi:hypothetical protein
MNQTGIHFISSRCDVEIYLLANHIQVGRHSHFTKPIENSKELFMEYWRKETVHS